MQEASRGYLMCIEAREDVFVRYAIFTKLCNFTQLFRLIVLLEQCLLQEQVSVINIEYTLSF